MYKKTTIAILLIPLLVGCQRASEILHKTVAPQVHNYDKSSNALKECHFNKAIEIVTQNQNELLKNSELGLTYYFEYNHQKSNQKFDQAIDIYRVNENKPIIALSSIVRNERALIKYFYTTTKR